MLRTNTISIIIPIYNAGLHLKDCLDSVISQSYINLEIILVNDGSTDGSVAICEMYAKNDNRIKFISSKNNGVSHARNLGIKKSTGDYITFLDADDWFKNDAMMNMMKIADEYSPDWVYGNYFDDDELRPITIKEGLYSKSNFKILAEAFMEGKMPCYSSLLFIKKSVLDSGIHFDEKLDYLEDKRLYAELLINLDTIYVTNIGIYNYRHNDLGATRSTIKYENNMNQAVYAYEKIRQSLGRHQSYEDAGKKVLAANLGLIYSYLYRVFKEGKAVRATATLSMLYENTGFMKMANGFNEIKSDDAISSSGYIKLLNHWVITKKPKTVLMVFHLRLILESIAQKAGRQ